ncbi:excalibur calcium-binding domain-containing protein [Streptomyces ziwulingensis]|uniref:Excalibur calcium-binding domain-containing protein n=1 Tax=Streptomyces ziwulingensis TaxID=1045501 RepID=A0ABP9C768_9ACTN
MNPLRKPAAVAIIALVLAALPATALAHDGGHPFENCAEAYEAGYANIQKGDEHYGAHLDRDGDGVGCDNPPADFVPADDEEAGVGSDSGSAPRDTDLAATGGGDATPYLAAGAGAVVLAGGGLLLAANKRRGPRRTQR